LAIGGTAGSPLRPRPPRATAIANTATAAQIAEGSKIYATYCVRCHGGGTILPDLRTSQPGIYTGLEKILDGSLVESGMPPFAELDKAAVAPLRGDLLDEPPPPGPGPSGGARPPLHPGRQAPA